MARLAHLTGAAVTAAVAIAGCGGSSAHRSAATTQAATQRTAVAQRVAPPPPPPPSWPIALPGASATGVIGWTPAIKLKGQPAAWIERVPAAGEPGTTVTLARFDQNLLTLALHAGGGDPGGFGWRYGPAVGPSERRHIVAAFNGGFRLSTDTGGFLSYGRSGAPLYSGFASVVTYRDGTTDVGAWREGVPAPGRPVASVRQTLHLLVDGGRPAPTVTGCGAACWGATLGGGPAVARSAIGITSGGRLVWAGGETLTVSALADALAGAGVTRAMELDINPEWVGGFLFGHRGTGPFVNPIALVPGQSPSSDLYLTGDSRDFFTVLAR